MTFFDKLFGNASEVDINQVQAELGHIFVSTEKVESAYIVIRDMMIFTDKRLVLVDRQGISGNKLSIISIPYKSIISFAIQTPGTFDFDLDCELLIHIKGSSAPIMQEFRQGGLIYKVQEDLLRHLE